MYQKMCKQSAAIRTAHARWTLKLLWRRLKLLWRWCAIPRARIRWLLIELLRRTATKLLLLKLLLAGRRRRLAVRWLWLKCHLITPLCM